MRQMKTESNGECKEDGNDREEQMKLADDAHDNNDFLLLIFAVYIHSIPSVVC